MKSQGLAWESRLSSEQAGLASRGWRECALTGKTAGASSWGWVAWG